MNVDNRILCLILLLLGNLYFGWRLTGLLGILFTAWYWKFFPVNKWFWGCCFLWLLGTFLLAFLTAFTLLCVSFFMVLESDSLLKFSLVIIVHLSQFLWILVHLVLLPWIIWHNAKRCYTWLVSRNCFSRKNFQNIWDKGITAGRKENKTTA